MDKEEVHQRLMTLELETTKMRYTMFAALLSISFLLPGLAVRADDKVVQWTLTVPVSVRTLVFLLGLLTYIAAMFHYWWHLAIPIFIVLG